MNHIAPRAEPLIREISLARLSLAPENVRKTPPDPQADAALKASIAAFDLMENLVVRPDEHGEDGNERFAVIAGGRRLKAMQALVEDGVFDAGHPVPCQVRTGDDDPAELSLAENVVRIAMHPADQVTAFAELVQAGQSVSAIAARFGASERIVEQRLRLGNAAPELLDAYRADEIDLEVLKAFAVTADRERQMAVWEHVSAQGYRPSAGQVRRLLTDERVSAGTTIGRFVGVDAYEAAGGAVMRDLFADEHEHGVWFEDPVLLQKLAMAKLQAAADELSTRWKWAIPMIDAGWDDTASYGRIEPQPGVPTDEEKAEIEKLETRYDELRGLDDDAWTEALLEEAGRIEARLDEIEGAVEARAMWRREDFAMAGCIATIGRDGALQVIAGLVKPEDMPKPADSGDAGTNAGNGHDPNATTHGVPAAGSALSQPVAGPRDREAEARKEAGVGIGLADDLRSIRTALVKAKLAGDFEAAFDLALFQMGRAVFRPGYHEYALDIAVKETPDRPNTRMNDADFAAWSPGEAMLEDRSHLSLDWLEIDDNGESFAALRALPRAEKEALFAACVARTVKGQLAFEPHARPELEATVATARHRLRGPCPPDRRHAVVADRQGTRPRHRAHGVRPGLGVGAVQVQEARPGRGDGGRFRRRRPARWGERRDAREGARLGPARLRGLRHRPDGRRRRERRDGSRRDRACSRIGGACPGPRAGGTGSRGGVRGTRRRCRNRAARPQRQRPHARAGWRTVGRRCGGQGCRRCR